MAVSIYAAKPYNLIRTASDHGKGDMMPTPVIASRACGFLVVMRVKSKVPPANAES